MVQLEMIERVKQLALQTEAVSAVLMYGSFVKGEGDRFSDIEFYIFLREEAGFDKRGWVAQVSPVDLFFPNEFGTEVAVFSNLVRGEFHFQPVENVEEVRMWQGVINFELADRMKLVDKDGRLAEVLGSIPPPLCPVHDTPENREWVAQQLMNNLIFELNLLKRGEHAHAHQLFWFVQRFLLMLIRLRCSATGHWEAPAKKLEEEIPEDWYTCYRECVPGLDAGEMKLSLGKSLALSGALFDDLDIGREIRTVLDKTREDFRKFV